MNTRRRPFAHIWALSLVPVVLQAATLRTDLEDLQADLGVPTSIAKVIDGSRVQSGIPEFILVQDIHRHPEVQGHIAAILLYGSHHWNVHDAYLEGARAGVDIAPRIPEPRTTLMEALQEGRVSGAEMALALDPNSPLRLHGLEDPGVYSENVAAYDAVQRLRAPAMQEIETARFLESSFDVQAPARDPSGLLQKMLQLRLKPADHAAYLQTPYTGQPGSALADALQAAEQFYNLADARSKIFLKNLEAGESHGPRMVVVGGYHTAAMARELKREGRSFVVFSPNVTQSGYDDLYARGMQQTISALQLR